jgi:hypothetical protein
LLKFRAMKASQRLASLVALLAPVLALGAQACSDDAEDGECTALPTCDEGEVEVPSCESRPGCHEVEACGSTIACEGVSSCQAEPACQSPAVEVQTCPAMATCVEETECGKTILCATTGMNPGTCTSTADCPMNEFCNWPDGLCGAGAPGACTPITSTCSDGVGVCYCDGTVTVNGDISCEGYQGKDFDSTGTACTLPATAFSCGHIVCDFGTNDYCQLTTNDTGGPPYVQCAYAAAQCDPATCACLTDEIAACGGTCTDGPNGPTITCPGG